MTQNIEFSGMTDDEVSQWLIGQGYHPNSFRKLDDGEWILLHQLAYTLSVCCGVGKSIVFKYRWCFKDPSEAIEFFKTCENFDDIPKKRDSLKGHRYLDKPLLVEHDELGYPKW